MFGTAGLAVASQLDQGKYPCTRFEERSSETEWRFRHCSDLRNTLLSVAEWAGASQKAVARFRACGSLAAVWRSESTGSLRVIANHCRNRWCPRCRSYVQTRTRKRIAKWLTTVDRKRLKFVTLTLRPSSQPLSEHLALLWSSFRRLRRSRLWRALNARGIGVAETTRGATGQHWHVHLHLLVESPYVDARKLSAAWRIASSGSFIVNVKQVRRDQPQEAIVHYLSSYLAKEPPGVSATDAALVTEWVTALTAQHWVVAFGRRVVPAAEPEAVTQLDAGPWVFVSTLAALLVSAARGHSDSILVLRELESAREGDSHFLSSPVCDDP